MSQERKKSEACAPWDDHRALASSAAGPKSVTSRGASLEEGADGRKWAPCAGSSDDLCTGNCEWRLASIALYSALLAEAATDDVW